MTVMRGVLATGIVLSDDPTWFPLGDIFNFLSQETFWAHDLPRDVFGRSIANSFCFAVYRLDGDGSHGELVGFACVIIDRATFAYLYDMLVLPALREEGISHALTDFLCEHPDLQTLRRTVLITIGAGWLYCKHGFADMSEGIGFMQLHWPNIYTAASA